MGRLTATTHGAHGEKKWKRNTKNARAGNVFNAVKIKGKTMTITDTCKCGAQFSAEDNYKPGDLFHPAMEQHDRWLIAHAYFREHLLITTTLPEVQAMKEE
jgi:hypothetical protein